MVVVDYQIGNFSIETITIIVVTIRLHQSNRFILFLRSTRKIAIFKFPLEKMTNLILHYKNGKIY